MSDIIFADMNDMYKKMAGKEPDKNKHGVLASFYFRMKAFEDPNTCACKKGKGAKDTLMKMYMTMPTMVRTEPLRSASKEIFGTGTLIFKINGIEFAKVV